MKDAVATGLSLFYFFFGISSTGPLSFYFIIIAATLAANLFERNLSKLDKK